MYKHLFGPVPSRRLGMSLGVDLVPHKVCSFNCIYCECGKTTNLTTERKEYVPVDDVLKELEDFFHTKPDPDYITFSGAGEPTLNSRFGEVLTFIKSKKPGIPLAVLTNGSLLSNPEVRKELLMSDLVLPSLDAATEKAFRKIDRPSGRVKLDEYIRGLVDFRKEFSGKIWLEIFILPGMNDDIENLDALKLAIGKIRPDAVQLNTLDRPGAVDNIVPATKNMLERIADYWALNNVEIIASAKERKDIKAYRDDMENTILELIARRPCTLEDLQKTLGLHINEINKYLGVFDEEQKIDVSIQPRGIFYQLKR